MLKKYIYVNDKIVLANKPAILVNDVGWLRGYGVFDFLRTYNGKIFRFADNWARFTNSAKQLNLKIPISQQEAEKIIYQLINKNKLKEAGIRLALSGGPAIDGGLIQFDPNKPTLAILIEDTHGLPAKLYQTGAKLMTFNYQRPLSGAKNFNYLWAIKLASEKKKQGATEILYVDQGKVLECSTSNFFLIKGNKLITAKDNVLLGITRKTVIELVKSPRGLASWSGKKLVVEERPVKVGELKTADECFITAANKKILPIVKIDSQKIGSSHPGPITKELIKLFEDYIKSY
ncbi:MAG: aminotransferase class IV [Candidatus Paceibacterota bacterium]|jgi:branched-subunit amino acid aminotransferase/4-amino-4-deoxychorismate lyase